MQQAMLSLALLGLGAQILKSRIILKTLRLCCLLPPPHPAPFVAFRLPFLVPPGQIIGNSIQDQRPIHRGKVTEVRILLDPDGPPSDVPQVVQPNFLEVGHLKDDQGIVVEKALAPNHRQVRKEVAEGLQASHTEKQQIIHDHGELGEAVVAKVRSLVDQQNLEISFHHRAALQLLQLLHTVADVDVWPTN
ncbi:hypothetical protein E2320_013565 [Naja naja]|nr:hypothetical protein E2320_013565 [Naja naja]